MADEPQRPRALTPEDIDEIKSISCRCPHGMTAQDVFRLREFLDWWEDAKSTVGAWTIKIIITLVVAIGVLVAWITNGTGKP